MRALVVLEHDSKVMRSGSYSAAAFASELVAPNSGSVELLILGYGIERLAQSAADFAPVFVADHETFTVPVADRVAAYIADFARSRAVDFVIAASTTFARDIVGRAAGLLGGAMASDVVGHEFSGGRLLLRRPMYAGALIATVTLSGSPQIITIRPSAYPPISPKSAPFGVTRLPVDTSKLPSAVRWERSESRCSTRPDVTEARIVVSGGRAFKDAHDFESCVGRLADRLGGACGCTRALVDSGIAPNELQIGQTGKVVAPDLYVALGLSGSVQHLAGMKNSKVIVVVNNDPLAPIFEVADYGLVGDVYEVVPQLLDQLSRTIAR